MKTVKNSIKNPLEWLQDKTHKNKIKIKANKSQIKVKCLRIMKVEATTHKSN